MFPCCAALLAALKEVLEVAEAPLKREYVLVLPDLVHDGQHKDAVGLLSALLQQDSQFTAPVLESLSSLQLDEEDEEEICGLVIGAVVSSKAADLPAIVRFLLAHLGEANATEVTTSLRHGLSKELLTAEPPSEAVGGANAGAEALLLDAVLSALRLRNELGALLLGELESIKRASEHRAIDWWLLCALSAAGDAKSKQRAARLLADKAAKHLLPPGLLRNAVAGHREALLPHFQLQNLSRQASCVPTRRPRVRSVGSCTLCSLRPSGSRRSVRSHWRAAHPCWPGATAETDAALTVLVQIATDEPGLCAVLGLSDRRARLPRRPLGAAGAPRVRAHRAHRV